MITEQSFGIVYFEYSLTSSPSFELLTNALAALWRIFILYSVEPPGTAHVIWFPLQYTSVSFYGKCVKILLNMFFVKAWTFLSIEDAPGKIMQHSLSWLPWHRKKGFC